ncbi:hypothetical protein J437_LFUL006991 [Ladona fulva]|uniref:Uncharacterized protein n=1 Tax=Ladona fulva TaxID=123851 RepID=A0A8K0K3K5_LADFU|nr:hypothetical protein J437_LFUL006991 [Ladona fulva]
MSTDSQFPVFTLFAQKLCLKGSGKTCGVGRRRKPWVVEVVPGFRLPIAALRTRPSSSRRQCSEYCLTETDFTCRSANYNYRTATCELSDMDRFTSWGQHTLVSSNKEGTLRRRSPKIKQKLRGGQATGSKAEESSPGNEFDYIESNCVSEPVKMCDFQEIEGKILKTVDSVRQDVGTLEDCRNLCLEANFRCHTFDFGDTGDRVCRLSHHSIASLLHIEEPYLEVAEATSYQVTSCYNVTIDCQATGMVARIKTNKIFNGKVYVKSRPNSCVLNVTNNLEFELPLEYHDLNCDVRQETPGKFTADIIIQHHDQIVTSEDVGLSVKCSYNLQNRSVSNGMQLEIGSEAMEEASESSYVLSPTVSMRITDRYGKDIHTAQVGDPLSLRFEILDADTPYDIFVRELIALDGVDGSEILLIDSLGCPTDPTIMGSLSKVESTETGKDSRVLQAPFDAFKFPTSDVVQFKALVTPCLPTCEPVLCQMEDYYGLVRQTNSYGRKKRSVGKINEEEMLVVQSIRIADKFQFERNRQEMDNSTNPFPHDKSGERLQNCMTSPGLLFTVFLFLFAQLLIIIVWGVLFYRRQSLQKGMKKELRIPSLDQPTHLFYRLNH